MSHRSRYDLQKDSNFEGQIPIVVSKCSLHAVNLDCRHNRITISIVQGLFEGPTRGTYGMISYLA